MPYSNRLWECIVCGTLFMYRKPKDWEPRCISHRIQLAVDNMMQQMYRQGPMYEKHLLGLKAYVDRELAKIIPASVVEKIVNGPHGNAD